MIEHYHCPNGCEHPQPMLIQMPYDTEVRICGRCFFESRQAVICEPCVPGENC